jgi:hypothetical protein
MSRDSNRRVVRIERRWLVALLIVASVMVPLQMSATAPPAEATCHATTTAGIPVIRRYGQSEPADRQADVGRFVRQAPCFTIVQPCIIRGCVDTPVILLPTTTSLPPPPPPGCPATRFCPVITTTTIYVPPPGPGSTTTTMATTTLAPVVAGIAISPLDFGGVAVGTRSNALPAQVSSSGNVPVQFKTIAATPPFAVVPGGTCDPKVPLRPGTSCTVLVIFAPTSAGPVSGALQLNGSSADGDRVYQGGLAGVGSSAVLQFVPSELDLGSGFVPAAGEGAVELRNAGSTTIIVSAIGTPAPQPKKNPKKKAPPAKVVALRAFPAEVKADTAACVGKTLAPGASCQMKLTVVPKTAGVKKFAFEARGRAGESAKGAVKREGVAPNLELTPAAADFTNAGQTPKTFTVRNPTKLAIQLGVSKVSGGPPGTFVIVGGTCVADFTVAPGKTCTIQVRSAVGNTSASAALEVPAKTVSIRRQAKLFVGVTTTVATTVATTTVLTTVVTAPPTTVPPTSPPTTLPPTTTITKVLPQLRMNPGVVQVGRVTIAEGRNFPAYTVVVLRWSGRDQRWSVKTNGQGAFDLPIVVLQGEPIGGRTMIAEGQPTFDEVSAPCLVQLPTFQPPGANGKNDRMVGRG